MRWLYEIAGACLGLACAGLFVAAANERAGRRADAGRRAYRAGVFAGSAGAVQLLLAVSLPWSSRQALLLAAGVGCAALCAAIALLAGLSRKPRPACWFAAGSWLLSIALRIVS